MTILFALLFLALGVGAGALHFAAISRDADHLIRGDGSAARAIGRKLGRMALTVTVLILAALHGWVALLAAMAGLLAARQMVLRRLGPSA
ncbi:MAG TPA: ATP synthase subunit I [Sphingomonas sp.]